MPLLSAVAAIGFSVALAASGVGYVWHRNRNAQLKSEILALRVHLDRLGQRSQVLDKELAQLQSTDRLRACAEKLNLGLRMPPPQQIVRLNEPTPETAASRPTLIRVAARR